MTEQFYYDIEEIKRNIDSELDELRRIRFSEKYHELLGETFIQKVKDWECAIRKQKELPFTIVICGSFKRGKSTLINALLGEEVVPTDVTTETITLNRVCYGEHSNALIMENGKRMVLTDEQLRRSELENILASLGGNAYQLEIRRPIELLKRINIVDTPGLDDSLQDFDEMVSEALVQADAVVYVFSSSYPLSMQEQLFLRTTIIPQKHTDLFLVSNYTDVLRNEKEYERMHKEIRKRIEIVLPGQSVYMLSALDERCRQMDVVRPNTIMQDKLSGNFDFFRQTILELIDRKSNTILVDRMERMLKGMRADLFASLDRIEQGLTLDKDKAYDERQKAEQSLRDMDNEQTRIMNELNRMFKSMESETAMWMRDLVQKMQGESLAEYDLVSIRKYYSLYCVDTLQKALEICADYHSQIIFDMLDEISGELTQKIFKTTENTHFRFSFAINNKTWSKGDNVGFISQTLLGTNILGLVGMAIGGAMRQSELQRNTSDVFSDINEQYRFLLESLPRTVQKAYVDMKNRIYKQIQEYFTDCAQKIESQTEQVINFAQKNQEEKEQSMLLVQMVRGILNDMKV